MNPTGKYLLYAQLSSGRYFVRLAGGSAGEADTETFYYADPSFLLAPMKLLDDCCDKAFDEASGHMLIAAFDDPRNLHTTHPELFI